MLVVEIQATGKAVNNFTIVHKMDIYWNSQYPKFIKCLLHISNQSIILPTIICYHVSKASSKLFLC